MRKVLLISCSVSVAMLLFCSSLLYAHGVRGKTGKGGIVVIAEYTTGEPMSYAKVNISAPGSKLSFQSGRTDRNGRFCFFPDAPGQWKVVVDDEIGHRLEVNVAVNKLLEIKSNQQNAGPFLGRLSEYERVLMGVSIIFGIAGIIFWWRGKRSRNV